MAGPCSPVSAGEMHRRDNEHVSLAQIFERNNSGSLILKTCKRRGVAGDARLEGRKARKVYQRPVEIGAKFTKWTAYFLRKGFPEFVSFLVSLRGAGIRSPGRVHGLRLC